MAFSAITMFRMATRPKKVLRSTSVHFLQQYALQLRILYSRNHVTINFHAAENTDADDHLLFAARLVNALVPIFVRADVGSSIPSLHPYFQKSAQTDILFQAHKLPASRFL